MSNLTEQWKKGNLPEGDYYIKRRNGDTLYDNIDSRGVWRNSIDEDIIEVLDEVPSYELWKAVHEQWKVLLKENTKLKELLKGAREVLKMVDTYCGDYDSINGFLIVEKINQVLGEDNG